MRRSSKLFWALATGLFATGACNLQLGDEATTRDPTVIAMQELDDTGIRADNIKTTAWSGSNGFQTQFDVTNIGSQATKNWQVELQLPNAGITGGPWNATSVPMSGSTVLLQADSNNAVLQPNAKVTVSFNGAWNTTPHTNPSIIAVRRDVAGTGGASGSGGTSSATSTARGGSGGTITGGSTNRGGSASGGVAVGSSSNRGGTLGSSTGGTTSRGGSADGGLGTGGVTSSTTSKGGTATGGNSSGGAATATVFDTGGAPGTNVAQSKPATASSELSPASNGNDIDVNTDWCANGPSGTWRVDLGASYDIIGTRITWPAAGAGYGYLIQASTDNIAFSNVIDKQVNASSSQIQSDSFTTRARWVGIQITKLPTGVTNACLRDFQVFGTKVPGTDGTGGSSSTGTLASGGTVGSGGDPASGGTTATGGITTGTTLSGGTTSTSTSTAIATAPVTFSFQLPKGVDRSRIEFGVTGGELWINDHAKVLSPLGTSSHASVSAVANGRVTRLGFAAEVQDLYSEGNVMLANGSVVHGDLYTRGSIDGQEGYFVGGKKVFNAPLNPTEIVQWTVDFPILSGNATILEPGTIASPTPGASTGYGIHNGAHLKLVAGTYFFNELTVESGGYLDIDNSAGPVIVYVRDSLTLRGNHSRSISGGGFFLGFAGTATVNIESPLQAILVAPNASVILATVADHYAGAFYAKSITVHQNNFVDFEPWTRSSLCPADAPCSPFCPCGANDDPLCTANQDCRAGLSCSTSGHCACAPQCGGKHCSDDLADGCGGTCQSVCSNGEIGCQSDTNCQPGSACLKGKGPLKGFPAGTNICMPAACSEADPRLASCGVPGLDCGTCPACVPDCTGRQCGPDGCGGSCGTPAANQFCLGGSLVDAVNPSVDHSSNFPSALPVDFSTSRTDAGAIPANFRVTERGTASYVIPLQLPPGRQGLVPNLSLTYESSRSLGMVGLGWAIGGYSKIERCNRIPAIFGKADPISLTASDAFCLDGAVLVDSIAADGSGMKPAHTHDTELEQFKVIQALGTQMNGTQYVGPAGFRVLTKDGHILTYGETDEYDVYAAHSTSSRDDAVVDAAQIHRAWHISKIEDHAGNSVSFYYERTTDDQGTTTEIVPIRVVYGQKRDPSSPATGPSFKPTTSVEFTYIQNNKPTHHYVAGYLAYQTKLLQKINTYNLSSGSGAYPITTYKLSYVNWGTVGPRLWKIGQCSSGWNGSGVAERCLPETEFDYSKFGDYFQVPGTGDSSSSPPCIALDADGDGRQEALCVVNEPSSGWKVRLVKYTDMGTATGGLSFSFVEGLPPEQALGEPLVTDVDRDGRDDVVVCPKYAFDTHGFVYLNRSTIASTTFVEQPLFMPEEPSAMKYALDCRLGDRDGDGLMDLILLDMLPYGSVPISWKRQGTTGLEAEMGIVQAPINDTQKILINDLDGDGDVEIFAILSNTNEVMRLDDSDAIPAEARYYSYVTPRLRLDVNGDGLTDYIGNSTLLVGNGRGFVEKQNGIFQHLASNPPGIVADVDGDGRDDIVTFGGDIFRATTRATLELDDMADTSMYGTVGSHVLLLDLNGDGAKDILLGAGQAANISQAPAPGLLTTVTNGVGERIQIHYDSLDNWPSLSGGSIRVPVYSAGGLTTPNANTQRLRRVSPLVSHYRRSQVNPADMLVSIPGTAQYFRYFAANMGLGGRGWFGFAERWTADVDATTNSVAETQVKYHNDVFWRAGLVQQVITEWAPITGGLVAPSYQRWVTTTNEWQQRTSSLSGRPYPWLQAQRITEYEGLELRRTEHEWTPDNYGNSTNTSTKIQVFDAVRDTTTIKTQYHVDSSRWLISLPELVSTFNSRDGSSEYRQVRYGYSDDGLVTSIVREPNRTELQLTATYDRNAASRNIEKITLTDPAGNSRIERIVYDQNDLFPVAQENAHGEVTEVQYDITNGKLVTVMDPNGVVTQWRYDPYGRISAVKWPTHQLTRTYQQTMASASTPAGGLVWMATTVQDDITPNGGSTTSGYDAHGRLVRTTEIGLHGTLVVQEIERDWRGNVLRTSQPHASSSLLQGSYLFDRDVLGRVTAMAAPDGRVTRYEYLSLGNSFDLGIFTDESVFALVRSDPNGLIEYRYSDERGLPTSVVQFDASTGATPHDAIAAGVASASKYRIGAFGIPLSLTDPDGEVTAIESDALGRRRQIESDSLGLTKNTYNAFDEVIDETDANGDRLCYSYDVLGRPITTRHPSSAGLCDNTGSLVASWQYGTDIGEIGKLTSSYRESFPGAGNGVMETFHYETPTAGAHYAARLKSVDRVVPGLDDSLTTAYDYDNQYLSDIHYPAAGGVPFGIHYLRDSYGHVTQVRDTSGTGSNIYWRLISSEEGQLISREAQNNSIIVTDYQYNRLGTSCSGSSCVPGTLRSMRTAVTKNPSVSLQHFQYSYDAGEYLQSVEYLEGDSVVNGKGYTNDVFGRLKRESEGYGAITSMTSYAYSPGGDIQSLTTSNMGGASTTETYAYDSTRPRLIKSLGSTTYNYDLKGRQSWRSGPAVAGGSQTIVYNEFDLPISVALAGGETHRFEYNASGNRVVKRSPDVTTVYAGDHYRCVGATTVGSNAVACEEHHYSVFVGDRQIAEITKDATGGISKQRYIHSNHLDSATLITDETGAVVEKREFKTFGQPSTAFADASLRTGFTGQEHDTELGLVNMRGRLYDPKLRRFITPDPFVTRPLSPQGLNRFAYVTNSPMNFVDPSGFDGTPPDRSGGTPGPGESTAGGSGGGSDNSRSMDSGGGPSNAQSPSGSYASGNGYGYYFTDAALLQAPSDQAATTPVLYSQVLDPAGQDVYVGPTPTVPNATGDVGQNTPQNGGTTISTTGPGTNASPNLSRSGDGHGSPRPQVRTPGDLALLVGTELVKRTVCGFLGCGSAGGAMGEGDPLQMSESEKIVNSALAAAGITSLGIAVGKAMFGSNGVQVTSKTVWQRGKQRIDVENPNPGRRPGQIHLQQGTDKYLYDPVTKTFPRAPNSVNDLLKDSSVQQAIEKALRYLGEL